MDYLEIIAQLENYIATQLLKQPARRIGVDQPLLSSGVLSSLQLVDVALYVEDTFGVRIDDTELTSTVFDSLGQLAAIITERRSAP